MFRQGISLKTLLQDPQLLAGPPKPGVDSKNQANALKKPAATTPVAQEPVKVVKNAGLEDPFLGQLAFLGPNIWDNKAADNTDAFGEVYMGLDEFLGEHAKIEEGILDNAALESILGTTTSEPSSPKAPKTPTSPLNLAIPPPQSLSELERHLTAQTSPQTSAVSPSSESRGKVMQMSPTQSTEDTSDRSSPGLTETFNESDLMLATAPGQKFDPRKRAFTDDELRPQPMIRKSRKQYVPDQEKDDKYWCKRKKNNVAAKRSRDARRIKENQIALRASFLEKENHKMREELEEARKQNSLLKQRLSRYEDV